MKQPFETARAWGFRAKVGCREAAGVIETMRSCMKSRTRYVAECLNSVMEIGEVWAFRDRPKAVGERVYRVEIVRVDGPRKQGDLHVRFLDGDETGLQEWVA